MPRIFNCKYITTIACSNDYLWLDCMNMWLISDSCMGNLHSRIWVSSLTGVWVKLRLRVGQRPRLWPTLSQSLTVPFHMKLGGGGGSSIPRCLAVGGGGDPDASAVRSLKPCTAHPYPAPLSPAPQSLPPLYAPPGGTVRVHTPSGIKHPPSQIIFRFCELIKICQFLPWNDFYFFLKRHYVYVALFQIMKILCDIFHKHDEQYILHNEHLTDFMQKIQYIIFRSSHLNYNYI